MQDYATRSALVSMQIASEVVQISVWNTFVFCVENSNADSRSAEQRNSTSVNALEGPSMAVLIHLFSSMALCPGDLIRKSTCIYIPTTLNECLDMVQIHRTKHSLIQMDINLIWNLFFLIIESGLSFEFDRYYSTSKFSLTKVWTMKLMVKTCSVIIKGERVPFC